MERFQGGQLRDSVVSSTGQTLPFLTAILSPLVLASDLPLPGFRLTTETIHTASQGWSLLSQYIPAFVTSLELPGLHLSFNFVHSIVLYRSFKFLYGGSRAYLLV